MVNQAFKEYKKTPLINGNNALSVKSEYLESNIHDENIDLNNDFNEFDMDNLTDKINLDQNEFDKDLIDININDYEGYSEQECGTDDDAFLNRYYEKNVDIVRDYLREIADYPVCTKEEEIEYIKKIRAGDQNAKEEFIKRNLKLVVYVAKSYIGVSSHSLMDLIQEGNIGLMKAIDRFDMEKNTKFSTYAYLWIKQSIGRSIINTGNAIRLPVHSYLMYVRAYKKAEEYSILNYDSLTWDLIEKFLREETDNEQVIQNIESYYNSKKIVSMDEIVSSSGDPDRDMTYEDTIPDNSASANPDSNADYLALKIEVEKAMECLSDKEKYVIYKRFGFDGEDPMTLDEVGKTMGVTREWVRQIEGRAIRKLRHPRIRAVLRDFVEK